MTKDEKPRFWVDFRRFFLRGLATLLPTILTIVLLVKCYEFIQENISVHITEGLIRLTVQLTDKYPSVDTADVAEAVKAGYPNLTQEEIKKYLKKDALPGVKLKYDDALLLARTRKLRQQWRQGPSSMIGFALAIVFVYILGRLLGSFIGRKLWRYFENAAQQVPLFKQVYPYIKQVTEFVFGEKKIEFSRVVAVEYPRKGIWSVGFVTGVGFKHVAEQTNTEFLTVFVPSSPTPLTGYVIYVKRDEVIDLPITIEEAFRFAISGGVIVPDRQTLPAQKLEMKHGPAPSPTDQPEADKKNTK